MMDKFLRRAKREAQTSSVQPRLSTLRYQNVPLPKVRGCFIFVSIPLLLYYLFFIYHSNENSVCSVYIYLL
jgi:hypothetical protein